MNYPSDLSGLEFGSLKVVCKTDKKVKSRQTVYNCICKCGNKKDVLRCNLVSNAVTSCGRCEYSKQFKKHRDINGRVFGDLKVIEKSDTRTKNGQVMWRCQCKCGNIVDIPINYLLHMNKVNCGNCYPDKDLTGLVFGDYTVLGESNRRTSNGVHFLICIDKSGNKKQISRGKLFQILNEKGLHSSD